MTDERKNHSPVSGEASDESAAADSPAQESSDAINLRRIGDIAELYGWKPEESRMSTWLEQQLAELDRHRVAEVERDARERENARSQHPAYRG